jgi:hypothetical protein
MQNSKESSDSVKTAVKVIMNNTNNRNNNRATVPELLLLADIS